MDCQIDSRLMARVLQGWGRTTAGCTWCAGTGCAVAAGGQVTLLFLCVIFKEILNQLSSSIVTDAALICCIK